MVGWPRWIREACQQLRMYIGTGRPPRTTRANSPKTPSGSGASSRSSRRSRSSSVEIKQESDSQSELPRIKKALSSVRGSRVKKRSPRRRRRVRPMAHPDLSTIEEESLTQSQKTFKQLQKQPEESMEDKMARMRNPNSPESPSIRAQQARGTKRRASADTETPAERLRRKSRRSSSGSICRGEPGNEESRGRKRSFTATGKSAEGPNSRPKKRARTTEHEDHSCADIPLPTIESEADDEAGGSSQDRSLTATGENAEGPNSRPTKRASTTKHEDHSCADIPPTKRARTPKHEDHSCADIPLPTIESEADDEAGGSSQEASSRSDRGSLSGRAAGKRDGAGYLNAAAHGRLAKTHDDASWRDTMDSAQHAARDDSSDLASTATARGTPGKTRSKGKGKGKAEQHAGTPNEAALRAEAQQLEGEAVIERGIVAHKNHPDFADRSQLEIDLFNWMNGRGLDPVFPAAWKADFSTFPDAMFVAAPSRDMSAAGPANAARPLIRSLQRDNFRALRHFQQLIAVGARVQERREQGLPTSMILQRAFNRYNNFVLADAGLAGRREVLRNLVVKASRLDENRGDLIARVNRDLAALAARHRTQAHADGDAAATTAPIVFALMIYGHVVVLVALDAADPNATPQARANFHYGAAGMDLWHAIGVAIIVALLRDEQVKRFGGVGETDNTGEAKAEDEAKAEEEGKAED